jgi:hypothetical protein
MLDGGNAEGSQSRDPVMSGPSLLNRSMPLQSPGPATRGLKHHAKFIEKNEC